MLVSWKISIWWAAWGRQLGSQWQILVSGQTLASSESQKALSFFLDLSVWWQFTHLGMLMWPLFSPLSWPWRHLWPRCDPSCCLVSTECFVLQLEPIAAQLKMNTDLLEHPFFVSIREPPFSMAANDPSQHWEHIAVHHVNLQHALQTNHKGCALLHKKRKLKTANNHSRQIL